MSKTSPMFSIKEENDREKFSCLYILVDAAVNQLEEINSKKRRLNHWKKKKKTEKCTFGNFKKIPKKFIKVRNNIKKISIQTICLKVLFSMIGLFS